MGERESRIARRGSRRNPSGIPIHPDNCPRARRQTACSSCSSSLSLPTHLSDEDNFCARRTNSLRRESRHRARPMLSRQSETQGSKGGGRTQRAQATGGMGKIYTCSPALRTEMGAGKETASGTGPSVRPSALPSVSVVRASGLEGNAGDRFARRGKILNADAESQ